MVNTVLPCVNLNLDKSLPQVTGSPMSDAHELLLTSLASRCESWEDQVLSNFPYIHESLLDINNCGGSWFLMLEIAVICSYILQPFCIGVTNLLFRPDILPLSYSFCCWWSVVIAL